MSLKLARPDHRQYRLGHFSRRSHPVRDIWLLAMERLIGLKALIMQGIPEDGKETP